MTSPALPAESPAAAQVFTNTAQVLARQPQTLTTNGAVTIDASTGNHFVVTLQANATSTTVTNPTTGQVITLKFLQDATGSRTYAWPANFKFGTGVTTGTTVASGAPTDGTASKGSSVTASYDGTNWNEIARSVAVG